MNKEQETAILQRIHELEAMRDWAWDGVQDAKKNKTHFGQMRAYGELAQSADYMIVWLLRNTGILRLNGRKPK